MSYPEKVQLVTGLIIWLVASGGYYLARFYYTQKQRSDLMPFLNIYMSAGFLIGTHQVFEFLSLYLQNHLIYKFGLLLSMSGMILYGISLEKLYNKDFYFKEIGLISLAISSLYLFTKSVKFTTVDFHLVHHSIFLWTLIWLVLLIYWNICILFGRNKINILLKLLYPSLTMMISFFISILYSLTAYLNYDKNICTTFPSIWCTLAFLQILFMPFFLLILPKIHTQNPSSAKIKISKLIFCGLISIFISIFILILLSKTGCFNKAFILS
jgi:hypothetical protein